MDGVDATDDLMFRFCPSVFFYLLCLVPTIWQLELDSVFFYLLCLVPTIWQLELDELEKRIAIKEREANVSTQMVQRHSLNLL